VKRDVLVENFQPPKIEVKPAKRTKRAASYAIGDDVDVERNTMNLDELHRKEIKKLNEDIGLLQEKLLASNNSLINEKKQVALIKEDLQNKINLVITKKNDIEKELQKTKILMQNKEKSVKNLEKEVKIFANSQKKFEEINREKEVLMEEVCKLKERFINYKDEAYKEAESRAKKNALHHSNKENEKLVKKIADVQAQYLMCSDDLITQLERSSAMVDEHNRKLKDLELKNHSMGSELLRYQSLLADKETEISDIQKIMDKHKNLEEILNEEREDKKTLCEKIVLLQETILSSREENVQLSNESTKKTEGFQQKINELEKGKSEYEAKLTEKSLLLTKMNLENLNMQQQLANLRNTEQILTESVPLNSEQWKVVGGDSNQGGNDGKG